MIYDIHWLCRKENVLQTLRKEIFTGYAGTKICPIFDNELVTRRFPVVMYISMWSYQMFYLFTDFYAELLILST